MENGGLTRRQKLVVVVLVALVLAVLVALTSLVRNDSGTSPLPTAVLPVARARTTPASATNRASSSLPDGTPTGTAVSEADAVQVARLLQPVSEAVGQIRELPKQQEIPLNFLSIDELESYLRRLRVDPARREFVQRQQQLLAALNLMPRVDEAFPTTVQTRARHVIAFFDPLQGQIFIGPLGLAVDQPDISLVHQFAHALIDQHFDLSQLLNERLSGDSVRALDALVEGDAMLVTGLYQSGSLDFGALDEFSLHLAGAELTDYEDYRMSLASEDLVLFPYREGVRFAAALLESGWWPLINAAYLNPPTSSEQILHPEKYLDVPKDDPRAVDLPDLTEDLAEGWRLVAQDVLGELVLLTHLDHFLPSTPDATEAASGWDGDLAALWQDAEGREVLVVRSVWDSPEDATEFANAYASLIETRLTDPRRVLRPIIPRGGRWWRGDAGDAYLQRDDDTVLIIWAPDTDVMERVLSAFLFGEE
jgi:hypothetical protein